MAHRDDEHAQTKNPSTEITRRDFVGHLGGIGTVCLFGGVIVTAGCGGTDEGNDTDENENEYVDGLGCTSCTGSATAVSCSSCTGSSTSSSCSSCTGSSTGASCSSCTGSSTSTGGCTSCTGGATGGCSGCSGSCKNDCHSGCSGTCSGGCKNLTN